MPIKYCTLPGGGDGFKWGDSGKCYPTRKQAEEQAAAAHANGFAGDMLAMDRASVRTKDVDGRLHVAISNISKANVSPYYGREIPNFEALGLNPDQIYNLLRDPEELVAAVDTFNNIPLLILHKPSVADAHPRELTVGTTGADAEFVDGYLRNSLIVWDQEGIDFIETETQKELSCGYRYEAVMIPGEFEGVKYDGRMTQIHGNHLALVEVGRAGPDVFVFDSIPLELSNMKATRKAKALSVGLMAYLTPKLAQDAAIDAKALGALIAKHNLNRPKIAAGVAELVKGKLAQDADLEDIAEVLEAVAPILEEEELSDEVPALDEEDDKYAALVAKLKGMLTPEQCAELGLDAEEPAKPEDGADKPGEVTKQAMDAAIENARKAAREEAKAVRQAEIDVRPLVGEIAPMESAEAVYRFALDSAKVDTKDVHPSAFRSLVQMAIKQREETPRAKLAHDAAAESDFDKRFPNASKLKVV